MGLIASCRTLAALHRAKRSFDERKADPRLSYLFWETTLACNLSCRHCGSRCSPETARSTDLASEEIGRIFTEVAQDFDARTITVAVTGGEPLVRPDVFDVMTGARELGFWWGMVTNGVLVTPAVVARMKAAGMGTVSVSIDGDAEAHALLRGSEESWHRSMRAVTLLREADFLDRVQVTTVVHRRNVDRLDAMYDAFAAAGAQEWRILMVDPIGRMQDPENADLLMGGPELRRLLDFVAERRCGAAMDVVFEESGFLGLEYEGRVRDYYFHCPAGIEVASILHDGAIAACPSLDRSMVEGNARVERLSDVWRERYGRYRDREGTRRCGPCASCSWWSYCEGGSLHLWDWERGEPRVCQYKMLNGG